MGVRSAQSGEQRWEKDPRPGTSHMSVSKQPGCAGKPRQGPTERFHRRTSHSNFHGPGGFGLKDTDVFNIHCLLYQHHHPYPSGIRGLSWGSYFFVNGLQLSRPRPGLGRAPGDLRQLRRQMGSQPVAELMAGYA